MVDPLSYFSFQPVLHDWCNIGCGMCYPVCEMVHIKELLLLIGKSSPCGGSRFPLSYYLNGPLPFIKSKYKGDNSVKLPQNGRIPYLKSSVVDCTSTSTDYYIAWYVKFCIYYITFCIFIKIIY